MRLAPFTQYTSNLGKSFIVSSSKYFVKTSCTYITHLSLSQSFSHVCVSICSHVLACTLTCVCCKRQSVTSQTLKQSMYLQKHFDPVQWSGTCSGYCTCCCSSHQVAPPHACLELNLCEVIWHQAIFTHVNNLHWKPIRIFFFTLKQINTLS